MWDSSWRRRYAVCPGFEIARPVEIWAEHDVRSHWGGVKRFRHSLAGPLTLEYSAFAVDGALGLSVVVFTPTSPADAQAIEVLISRRNQAA
jgi:hypothetical protein